MPKRKRLEDREVDEAGREPPRVTLEYSDLPLQSLKKLESLLKEWAIWHCQTFVQSYVAPEVLRGSLSYCPDTMRVPLSAPLAFEDLPAYPTEQQTTPVNSSARAFNVKYEKNGDVPAYDRTFDLTNPAAREPIAGNTNAADSSRAALESYRLHQPTDVDNNKDDADIVLLDNGTGGSRPIKRARGGSRCFNCGSYSHGLRDCWKELNQAAINAARREFGIVKDANTGRMLPMRYFLDTAAHDGQLPFEMESSADLIRQYPDIKPGKLSHVTRTALGIGRLSIVLIPPLEYVSAGPDGAPPWLLTMRAIGLPPSYTVLKPKQQISNEEKDSIQQDANAANQLFKKEEGVPSEDKTTKPSMEETDKAAPDANDIEDAPDYIGLGDDVHEASAHQQQAEQLEAVCLVRYPGVNAPLPEEIEPAKWGLEESWKEISGSIPLKPAMVEQQRHFPPLPSGTPPPPPPVDNNVNYYVSGYEGWHHGYDYQSYQAAYTNQYMPPPLPPGPPPPLAGNSSYDWQAYQSGYHQHHWQQHYGVASLNPMYPPPPFPPPLPPPLPDEEEDDDEGGEYKPLQYNYDERR